MTAFDTDRASGANATLEGIAMMATGVMLLPMMDTIARYLSTVQSMAPGQITFYRFLLQFVFTLPAVVVLGGWASLRPKRPWLNLLRGLLLGGASLIFFTALKYMPVADSIAIFFVEPFILTALSALVLKEPVGWRRWLAIAVGFVGAVIVINPSFARFGPVALLPLGTATLFACYMLMNRALGRVDSALVMQYVAGAGGTLLLGSVVALGGTVAHVDNFAPSLPQDGFACLLLVVLGTIAAYGHMIVVKAFQRAPASLLAPFQYMEIVSAAVLGYLVFAEFPVPSKLLGIAIIVGAGLFIVWRERQLGKAARMARR